MNFQNKSLLSVTSLLLLIASLLAACHSRTSKDANAEGGSFQCISSTIMIAGKPTATVLEWNTKTGTARILDSMLVTSKATGAQNVVVGWIPLGDLQGAIQEIVTRNQALQQQQQAAPVVQQATPAVSQDAAAALATKGKKKS